MTKSRAMAAFRVLLALTLSTLIAFPTAAFAAQTDVRISEYSTFQDARRSVSKLTIEGVEKPKPGSKLDTSARVTTAEGESWEIPVLWLDSNLQPATKAVEGETYLPVFSFYLPANYTIADADDTGAFAITFSPEIAALLGTQSVISIYDAKTGITYLLPSSIRSYIDAVLVASSSEVLDNQNAAKAEGPFTNDAPSTELPKPGQPTTNEPDASQPVNGQPSTNQPEPGRSDTDQPATNQPDNNETNTDEPGTTKHSGSKTDDDDPESVKPTI
ncbi:MAG: hypothetical protein Q4B54_07280, partial [Coriobacteriales bacterium]|nr:hypothetical protein [Coriobacteriales bacterium]